MYSNMSLLLLLLLKLLPLLVLLLYSTTLIDILFFSCQHPEKIARGPEWLRLLFHRIRIHVSLHRCR